MAHFKRFKYPFDAAYSGSVGFFLYFDLFTPQRKVTPLLPLLLLPSPPLPSSPPLPLSSSLSLLLLDTCSHKRFLSFKNFNHLLSTCMRTHSILVPSRWQKTCHGLRRLVREEGGRREGGGREEGGREGGRREEGGGRREGGGREEGEEGGGGSEEGVSE